MGIRLGNMLFEIPKISKTVIKQCRGCIVVIGLNEGSAVATAKTCLFESLLHVCSGREDPQI